MLMRQVIPFAPALYGALWNAAATTTRFSIRLDPGRGPFVVVGAKDTSTNTRPRYTVRANGVRYLDSTFHLRSSYQGLRLDWPRPFVVERGGQIDVEATAEDVFSTSEGVTFEGFHLIGPRADEDARALRAAGELWGESLEIATSSSNTDRTGELVMARDTLVERVRFLYVAASVGTVSSFAVRIGDLLWTPQVLVSTGILPEYDGDAGGVLGLLLRQAETIRVRQIYAATTVTTRPTFLGMRRWVG
jgi:hypothetical protein